MYLQAGLEQEMRDDKGRFIPGVSGNPSGSSKEQFEVARAAREHTPEALKVLSTAMKIADKWSDRINAAKALLDRGWGTAPQSITLETPNGLQVGIDASRRETREEWLARRAKLNANGVNGVHHATNGAATPSE